ncbi:MAG: hypothetical protein EXR83_12445 [Gammaproteobacteria bacterium]|nr:hypothetical protein [Gammaproteobacteria bacterium]
MRRLSVLWCVLSWAGAAGAGHGLLNSFAGIEWLPPPGGTPDSVFYGPERWWDQRALAAAHEPMQRMRLAVGLARERLAEALAMVRADEPAALQLALADWQAMLAVAVSASAELGDGVRVELANAVLEQRYIAATEYLDLPHAARAPLLSSLQAVAASYAALAATLARARREALFFREEEARWSVEMAQAADEQGL